jgi:hypothetical protein
MTNAQIVRVVVGLVKEPKQSKGQRKELQTWAILHVGDKLRWLGDVVASDAQTALAEGAKRFDKDAKELMAERRRWSRG